MRISDYRPSRAIMQLEFQFEFKFDYGGHVIIEALPPVDASSFEDIDDLIAECRKRMEEAYERINRELCPSDQSIAASETANGITSTAENALKSS
ncbi:unnamed protein product [Toxocara canis]|uniref:WS_DGAT_C domain-containing protein n=1 Tax=Toxocara canis TaxID=6265 RepID=A0A183V188_TOXCA|nr:unnamed protein product [Toxocara canis]